MKSKKKNNKSKEAVQLVFKIQQIKDQIEELNELIKSHEEKIQLLLKLMSLEEYTEFCDKSGYLDIEYIK